MAAHDNVPATKLLITRRINATLEATGQKLGKEERELLHANVMSLAKNHPAYINTTGTPAERITSADLADALIRLHFSGHEAPFDLTAKEVDAAECLSAAKKLIQSERTHDTKMKVQAQESRRPPHYGSGIREVNTRDMGLPKGFVIE